MEKHEEIAAGLMATLKKIQGIALGRDSLDGFPRQKDEKQRRLAEIYDLAFSATVSEVMGGK